MCELYKSIKELYNAPTTLHYSFAFGETIGSRLADITHSFHRSGQFTLIQKLFDVVSGFESLKKTGKTNN